MKNNEKYKIDFVMTKWGKVDITISRIDGRKITLNEQKEICQAVTKEWGGAIV